MSDTSEPRDIPDSGYPEEGPPGAAPDGTGAGDGSTVREKSQPDVEGAPDNDDGKATGNPNN